MTKDQAGQGHAAAQRPAAAELLGNLQEPRIPDAYERLLLEVMKGNQNLFVRKDEIEYA